MNYGMLKKKKVDAWEHKYIARKLKEYGSATRLAKYLRIDPSNLFRIMRKHGIKSGRKRGQKDRDLIVDKR